jgi:hypothetical protein
MLQQLRRNGKPGQSGTEFAARMKADFESAARSAGVKDEDIEGLMKQVQEAASSASQSGDRDAVKNAVDTVLQKNGVDMDKFHAAMEANRPKGGPGGGHGPRGAGGPPPSGGPGGGAGTQSANSPSSQIQELLKQLQSGESSDTDQSDLVSLLKQLTGDSGGLVDVAA